MVSALTQTVTAFTKILIATKHNFMAATQDGRDVAGCGRLLIAVFAHKDGAGDNTAEVVNGLHTPTAKIERLALRQIVCTCLLSKRN